MRGFISYTHDDYRMFCELRKHLRAVERALDLAFWADIRIHGGSHWSEVIAQAIEGADVFILLASPGFIASDYIYDREIPAIQEKHRRGALVLPVVLKRCAWQMIANTLQAIPMKEGRLIPISEQRPQNDGFDLARSQILDAICKYFGLSADPLDWEAS
jgi:hypothetical protein